MAAAPSGDRAPLLNSSSSSVGGGTFAPAVGLSSGDAARRLRNDGPNALEPPERESFLRILLRQAARNGRGVLVVGEGVGVSKGLLLVSLEWGVN